jgi:hypothetical protein
VSAEDYAHGRADAAADIRAVAATKDRKRPLRKDAEVATDFADDMEWAAMVAEGFIRVTVDEAGESGVLTPTIITVDGKPFRCQCGANVFTHDSATDEYTCNGCGRVYKEEQ